MNSIEQWVRNLDPYLTLIGLFFGLIGIICAFYFFFKSRLVKELSLSINSFKIASRSDKFRKLQFLYDGHQVEKIVGSLVAFWNSGNVTINDTDVVPMSPIEVSMRDGHTIYDIEILSGFETSNNFQIENIAANAYKIRFDYVDKNEGCVIRILHSGGLSVGGKIKGIRKFKVVQVYEIRKFPKKKMLGSKWIARNAFRVILSIGIFIPLLVFILNNSRGSLGIAGMFAFFLVADLLTKKYVPEKIQIALLDS